MMRDTMDLRRAFFAQGMKLLRDPRVQRVLADPRAMDVFVAAVRSKDRVTAAIDLARARLARRRDAP